MNFKKIALGLWSNSVWSNSYSLVKSYNLRSFVGHLGLRSLFSLDIKTWGNLPPSKRWQSRDRGNLRTLFELQWKTPLCDPQIATVLIVFKTGLSGWIFFVFWFLLFRREKIIEELYSVWNNRRLIGGCLYSLVLARGLFLKRFPSLVGTWVGKGTRFSGFTIKVFTRRTSGFWPEWAGISLGQALVT